MHIKAVKEKLKSPILCIYKNENLCALARIASCINACIPLPVNNKSLLKVVQKNIIELKIKD
jgi:hypothetical protein